MIRAVVDTNVWISSIVQEGGPPGQLRELLLAGQLGVICSTPLLEELLDVLSRAKIKKLITLRESEVAALVGLLKRCDEFVEKLPDVEAVIEDDPDDDLILATAVAAHADVIVSGDRHLLAIERYRGIPIVTPREFLQMMAEAEKEEPT